MEILMQKSIIIRGALLMTLACLVAQSLGCVEPPPRSKPPDATTAITDVKQVAGDWEGMVWMKSRQFWLQIRITEDGTVEGGSTGDFKGHFSEDEQHTLHDGKLEWGPKEGEQEYAIYTLAERNGKPVLLLEARTKRGIKVRGELAPRRSK